MAGTATDRSGSLQRTQHRALGVALLGLLSFAVLSTVLLGFGVFSADLAFSFSQVAYVIVPAGAGLVLVAAAMNNTGRSRVAWMTIGSGVLAWGIGEIVWVYYEGVLKTEVPYPGWADVFYVLGYPLIFVGVLLLPHVNPGRLERMRLSLDALAGSIAVAAIMWVAYLGDQIYLDPEVGFLEQFVNIMYPLGDVFLLVALMILAVRRSSRRFDFRLLALSSSLIVAFAADFIYIIQVEADTYVSGGWLDALWLLDNAAIIVAAWYLLRPPRETEQTDRSARLWQIAVPYTVIATLFALTLLDMGGGASILQIASGIVGVLIIARQGVAIRENRELVEKQRDDLIASISHELRTPLTSLQGFAELLNSSGDQLEPTQRAELTEIIERQSRHLGGIVTDLVDVARDQLSDADLALDVCDLAEIVSEATAMLPGSVTGNGDLRSELQPDIEVNVDRRRLTQVIINLLSNAYRYGDGQVEIETFAANGSVTIRVHDNGPGIAKRYEEAIWDRFERGAHRFDSTVPGSGIGLPIARSLAEAHGGSLRHGVSSKLGGACFTLTMPRAVGRADEILHDEPVLA